jgi:hypothetical protein
VHAGAGASSPAPPRRGGFSLLQATRISCRHLAATHGGAARVEAALRRARRAAAAQETGCARGRAACMAKKHRLRAKRLCSAAARAQRSWPAAAARRAGDRMTG